MYSRGSAKAGGPDYEQVRSLVAEGRLGEALTAFRDSLGTAEPELADQATALSGRFSKFAADELHQRITHEAANVERQLITEALLKLIRAAEGHGAPKSGVTPLSAKERQARTWYLKALRKKVENLINASIHKARLLDLGIQDTREATYVPWTYLGADTQSFSHIQEALETYEGRLLVLGAPGSGKTTTLQHIALQLVEQAEKDEDAPIPVLVNLSKFRMDAPEPLLRKWMWWHSRGTASAQRFEKWLADEIATNPDVSHAVALKWIQEDRVAALLDGLDEVGHERRADLVQLLNRTFLLDHRHSTVVVSSRVDEYAPLKGQEQKRLQLYGAVTLTPLSTDQIRAYLSAARADGLSQALEKDTSLMELARTPLTLSMMTLAYADLPESAIRADLPLTDRRHHLMEAYVSRMLQRSERRERGNSIEAQRGPDVPTSQYRYSPEKVNRYLGWLAVRLSVRMQTASSVGQFYSFLSRPPATGQPSPDRWATSLTLAFFTAVAHAFVALSLVPDASSVLPAAAMIVGGNAVFALRSQGAFEHPKLPDPIKGLLLLMGLIGGVAWVPVALAIVATALSSLTGGRWSPMEIGLLMVNALMVLLSQRSWRFWMGTAVSLAVGVVLSQRFPSGWPEGLVLPATLLVGQMVTLTWLLLRFARMMETVGRPLVLALFAVMFFPVLLFMMLLVGGLVGGLHWLPLNSGYLALGVLMVALSLLVPAERTAVVPSLVLPACMGIGALLAGREGAVAAAVLFGFMVIEALNWREYARKKQSFITRVFQYATGKLADIEAFVERWVLSPVLLFMIALSRALPTDAASFFRYCGRALLLKSAEREVEFIHRRLRDHFALRELMPRLQAAEMGVRLAAIRDVGYQGASAVETLAELSLDRDPEVRTAAVSALGNISAPEVVALLLRALEDKALQVRLAAISGYRGIPAEALGKLLMRAASDERVEVQLAAVEAATAADHPEALAVIERVLSQRMEPETFKRVLRLVGSLTDQLPKNARGLGAVARALPVSSGAVLCELAREEDASVRIVAMKLMEARPELAEPAHTIERLAQDESPVVRRLACGVLEKLYRKEMERQGPAQPSSSLPEAMRRIRHALTSAWEDPNANVRARAIRSVGSLGEPQSIEAIRPLLKADSAEVRGAVAHVLGAGGDLRDEAALRSLLQDPDENVRRAAAKALGELGATSSTERLIQALGDRAPAVRRAAAVTLGKIKATKATKALKKAAHDRNASVSIAASLALLRITGDPTALFEHAKHPAASARGELAKTLGLFPQDERVIKVLESLLKDPDTDVRQKASAALERGRIPRSESGADKR